MQDKNKEVRRVDPDWASRIKLARFRNHNQTWLETIEGQQVSYEDDEQVPNQEPYGFNSMPFGEQDDYLDQFGYNDAGRIFFLKLSSY
jgi:hypothetical protein